MKMPDHEDNYDWRFLPTDYDWRDDAIKCWHLAISELRKEGIAAGDIDWVTIPEMYISEAGPGMSPMNPMRKQPKSKPAETGERPLDGVVSRPSREGGIPALDRAKDQCAWIEASGLACGLRVTHGQLYCLTHYEQTLARRRREAAE